MDLPSDVMNEIYKYLPYSLFLTTARLVNKKMENETRPQYIDKLKDIADIVECDEQLNSCNLGFKAWRHKMDISINPRVDTSKSPQGRFLSVEKDLVIAVKGDYGMSWMCIPDDERYRFAEFLRLAAHIIEN